MINNFLDATFIITLSICRSKKNGKHQNSKELMQSLYAKTLFLNLWDDAKTMKRLQVSIHVLLEGCDIKYNITIVINSMITIKPYIQYGFLKYRILCI